MVQKPKVYVVGVGMTKFEKPGRREDFDYPDMAKEAVTKALQDARASYNDVQAVCVGYVYGDSTCGQRAVYEIGLTGCPIYNVNNNCSTGSTALYLGKQIIESGNAQCVLALGFEKMERGSLMSKYTDRTNPMGKHVELMAELAGENFRILKYERIITLMYLFIYFLCNFRYFYRSHCCSIIWQCRS